MSFKICELLNIEQPIIQGGMAWVANASLAAGVSNAGGLGIIAAGNAPASFVKEEIRKAKALTNKTFGVNIMLLSPYVDEVVEAIIEEGVKVVTTGAGNPSKYMELFKENDIKVIPVIPSVALAKRMEKIGACAVIAEGMEAGGHIGKLTSVALIPQVVDAVNIPVIAAGGIADGRAIAAMISLGAQGVQIGTRFVVSHECSAHDNYKKAIIKANDIDTTVSGSITGHPVRIIRNKLARVFEAAEKEEMAKENPDLDRIEQLGSGSLRKAVIDGDMDGGSIMAGQVAGLVKKEQSCKEIIDEVMEEFREVIRENYKKYI